MKRYLAIFFGLITLTLVNSAVFQQEKLINVGRSLFVELKPLDPRSLLQGDYMALRYELNIDPNSYLNHPIPDNATISLQNYRVTVTLDEKSRVIKSTFNLPDRLSDRQHLLIVKADSWSDQFYPASNSFLFAEGLAYCYENARYAELKVNEYGKPLLYRLTDEELQPLQCEEKHRDERESLDSLLN